MPVLVGFQMPRPVLMSTTHLTKPSSRMRSSATLAWSMTFWTCSASFRTSWYRSVDSTYSRTCVGVETQPEAMTSSTAR